MTNVSSVSRQSAQREDELVREHLDLVRKMVHHAASRIPAHVPRDDLLSAGMAALAMAARNFDEARGVPFDRYAATRVRGAIIDELRSFDWASRPVRTRARALATTKERLTCKLGRVPEPAELAEASGISVDTLNRLAGDVHRAVVLNYEAMLETGDSTVVLPCSTDNPEEELLARERAECVTRAIEALPKRLQVVVRGYFFDERTVADIAEELGVTQSRVSQLRAEAMDLLRDGVNAQLEPTNVTPLRGTTGRVSRRQAAYRSALASAV
ncbi:MAG: sigma-70 family RNA polymerase sigma factor [Acidimicrobiales bacterium]